MFRGSRRETVRHYFWHREERELEQNELNEVELSIYEINFLAAGKTWTAICRSKPGLKEKAFDSSGFSAEGPFISASTVFHCGKEEEEEEEEEDRHLSQFWGGDYIHRPTRTVPALSLIHI